MACISGSIAAAGAIGGALISSSGAQSAADTEAAGASQADATQLNMFNKDQANLAPYLGNGISADNTLAYLMGTPGTTPPNAAGGTGPGAAGGAAYDPTAGVNTSLGAAGSLAQPFTAADFTADPGYQFSVDQGTQALQRSAAAKGGLMSGAALKDLSTYAQGTAAQEYQSVYDRYNTNQNNLYSRLAGLSNAGQGAANTTGQMGTTTGADIANTQTSAASAQAAAQVAGTNAIGSGLTTAMNALSGPIGSWSTGLGSNLPVNGQGAAANAAWQQAYNE